ncbi:hypothetical protein [Kaistella carnis]|uniref:hypothetical protein n=1 Tax=Kaistella carnis TaxID=1241979 RepID=UPI00289FD61F|nr:hypothetical protein [Kaistella carnis]
MLKRNHILFWILIILSSCEKEFKVHGYEKFKIDKNINKNSAFHIMNKNAEFDFGYRFRQIQKNQKRSNNLNITTELGGIKNNYKKFNSQSYFLNDFENKKTDTLLILVDNFDGYSGIGVNLKIYKKLFKQDYTESSDVIVSNKKRDSVIVIENELVLNKISYKIGDSIHGYLNLKMIKNEEKISAKGYFRTKISKGYF